MRERWQIEAERAEKEQLRRLLLPPTPPQLRRRKGERLPKNLLTPEARKSIAATLAQYCGNTLPIDTMLERADLETQYYWLSRRRKYPTTKAERRAEYNRLTKASNAVDKLKENIDKLHVDVAARLYRYLGHKAASEGRVLLRLDAGYSVLCSLKPALDFARKQTMKPTGPNKNEALNWLYINLAALWPERFHWTDIELDGFKGITNRSGPSENVLGSTFVRMVIKEASLEAEKRGEEFATVAKLERPDPEFMRLLITAYANKEHQSLRHAFELSDSEEIDHRVREIELGI